MLLRKLQPTGTAAEVTRAWEGKAAVLIASGPSTTRAHLEHVAAARKADLCRVIVTNDMYLVAPWADVLYFADFKWWQWHTEGVAKSWPWASFSAPEVAAAFRSFAGQKVTIKHNPMASGDDILALANGGHEGLSETPTAIRTGGNSGFQALNIAALSGANPLILLGYDLRFDGRRTHSHNGHQQPYQQRESTYTGYAQKFATVEAPLKKLGIRVINCSNGSALGKRFEIGEIEKCLPLGPASDLSLGTGPRLSATA